jgi:hypothetical protein
MATIEYYRKQVELLLVWAMATTNPDLKAKLLARALEFLALVDCVDDGMLRGFPCSPSSTHSYCTNRRIATVL